MTLLCPECGTLCTCRESDLTDSIVCSHCQSEVNDPFPVEVDDERCEGYIAYESVPIILDFYSSYCGPCMAMYDDYEDAALSLNVKVRFLKINTDKHQKVAQAYGVSGVPCLIAFKEGQEVERVSRALSRVELTLWAESLL